MDGKLSKEERSRIFYRVWVQSSPRHWIATCDGGVESSQTVNDLEYLREVRSDLVHALERVDTQILEQQQRENQSTG